MQPLATIGAMCKNYNRRNMQEIQSTAGSNISKSTKLIRFIGMKVSKTSGCRQITQIRVPDQFHASLSGFPEFIPRKCLFATWKRMEIVDKDQIYWDEGFQDKWLQTDYSDQGLSARKVSCLLHNGEKMDADISQIYLKFSRNKYQEKMLDKC